MRIARQGRRKLPRRGVRRKSLVVRLSVDSFSAYLGFFLCTFDFTTICYPQSGYERPHRAAVLWQSPVMGSYWSVKTSWASLCCQLMLIQLRSFFSVTSLTTVSRKEFKCAWCLHHTLPTIPPGRQCAIDRVTYPIRPVTGRPVNLPPPPGLLVHVQASDILSSTVSLDAREQQDKRRSEVDCEWVVVRVLNKVNKVQGGESGGRSWMTGWCGAVVVRWCHLWCVFCVRS